MLTTAVVVDVDVDVDEEEEVVVVVAVALHQKAKMWSRSCLSTFVASGPHAGWSTRTMRK
jgi:hypothetical protein